MKNIRIVREIHTGEWLLWTAENSKADTFVDKIAEYPILYKSLFHGLKLFDRIFNRIRYIEIED